MKAYAITDVGRKRNMNQDSVFASAEPVGNLPNLFIVADGMGGHNAGDFASRYTVETIVRSISESGEKNPIRLIRKAIEEANEGVRREAAEHPEMAGMGTTAVVTTVVGNFAYTANVGDSRLYLINDDIVQITRDHSFDYKVTPGSTILMCTDGLTNMVADGEIEGIVEGQLSAEEKARRLVDAANAHGGADNIGVVIVEPDADEEEEC